MTKGYFYCKVCDIKFKGEYEAQQRPRRSCPTCHKSCDLTKKNIKQKSIPPQNTTQQAPQFIDDSDELLLSVAKRELNKPNPDPRWANILISCKKEKITSKNEVIDQFKQASTKALIGLLKKSLQDVLS